MHRFLALSALTLATCSLAVPATQAQVSPPNVECNGSLGAVTIDNLEVLEFSTCVLNGTKVLGSISVKPQARLTADNVSVRGNVEATEAVSVIVRTSAVGGDLMSVQGRTARFVRNTVAGDILVDGQSGVVVVNGNRVGTGVAGNVEVYGNLGGTQVFNNRIGGNLQCKDNLPVPTGGNNIVTGNKEDQCMTF
jgi:hypothetical protein